MLSQEILILLQLKMLQRYAGTDIRFILIKICTFLCYSGMIRYKNLLDSQNNVMKKYIKRSLLNFREI